MISTVPDIEIRDAGTFGTFINEAGPSPGIANISVDSSLASSRAMIGPCVNFADQVRTILAGYRQEEEIRQRYRAQRKAQRFR